MVFNNIKKYLLVFSAILLIGGNIGFSSDYDNYDNYDHDNGKTKQYQLIGEISEYILKNNIKNIDELIQTFNKKNNEQYNEIDKVHEFELLGRDKPENQIDYTHYFTIEGEEKPENEIDQVNEFKLPGIDRPENRVDYTHDFTIEGTKKSENEIEPVENFFIEQQDKLRNDTIKKAFEQAKAKFEEE